MAAVEEDESLTTQMLAKDFNVDHSTIVCGLKKLGKVWKLAGWVSHELSYNNNVQIFSDLQQQNKQAPFPKNLVTRDESWLLLRNIKRRSVFCQKFHQKEYQKMCTV